ncbi:KpsF/GutQ family sugar-phosphate isomerase [Aliiglaciecola sp. 3_MG-2023]|uniref:KpsF/GutQ family sugar-phosphate isomerase n=1 Tax=Aliiglaciecola sp. 3_MG-2023 TaxID=3062644 RepID=UPI0026E2BFA8|nr:KpsF/GutQ family sugar-phosphate isomerase [Aliiglaciecola sp. 3_MG-2023]MDO6695106.1 KpsF/GutQ family sugar-phosphate isomerase [Aliiglaciecola sp. 3_MG-2023]
MSSDYIASARKVLEIESQAVLQLQQYIDESFARSCQIIRKCKGKVVVSGMGKSGHIGHKIAATLASTGTPAFFMHPGEANHGDLGMISPQDVLIAISNSGETAELLNLIPVVKRLEVPIISMTNSKQSSLGKYSDEVLCIKVEQEACSLGLAPTASTTATLAMGDALAVALLNASGFTSADFALSHPGGSLGRRLLLTIADIMHTGDELPLVEFNQTVRNALFEISKKGLGMTGITDKEGKLVGIFTDGDLRRILDDRVDIHETLVSDVMTTNSKTSRPEMLAVEGLNLMEKYSINSMFAVDRENKPVGALNMHMLLKAGVV